MNDGIWVDETITNPEFLARWQEALEKAGPLEITNYLEIPNTEGKLLLPTRTVEWKKQSKDKETKE